METMCWEIRVDAGGFLKGVIMAQCYGITLQFQGNGTRRSVEHPGSANLCRTKRSEASEVIGSVEQGMGMRNQQWHQWARFLVGNRGSVEVNRKALA